MVSPPILTLLTRAYCHLCDDMRDAVAPLAARFGVHLVELDVDADPALEERYGERVPVLLRGSPLEGVELCHYTLDRAVVERSLTNT
ncbi:MAG TPA: glutaredoxin family protein [Casimicrobiaceae bacterium]